MKLISLIILVFVHATSLITAQTPNNKYIDKNNCEYLNFINDSLIELLTVGSYSGALIDYYSGIGKYVIIKNNLTVEIISRNKFNDIYISRLSYPSGCSEIKEFPEGILKYKIQYLTNDTIKLIGPIFDNYKKLNKQRFYSGFVHWPWKWSFRKQHWYDPRQRILCKIKIN